MGEGRGGIWRSARACSCWKSDNRRLRGLLELKQQGSGEGEVPAAVISRSTASGWWQQLELGKGSLQGLAQGDAVLGPGGLVGRIAERHARQRRG